MRIGFLHTAQVHVDTFTDLVTDAALGATSAHLVRPDLLDYARVHGVDDHLKARLAAAIGELLADDVDIVVCTCSTISGAAEQYGNADGRVEVIRIDRPMAALAVQKAAASDSGRIVVVTAVESAAAPSIELLEQEASRLGSTPKIEHLFCEGAWTHFEQGDTDAYLGTVAKAIDTVESAVEVVVVAQASMAGATGLVTTPGRLLTSPGLAVAAALNRGQRNT